MSFCLLFQFSQIIRPQNYLRLWLPALYSAPKGMNCILRDLSVLLLTVCPWYGHRLHMCAHVAVTDQGPLFSRASTLTVSSASSANKGTKSHLTHIWGFSRILQAKNTKFVLDSWVISVTGILIIWFHLSST